MMVDDADGMQQTYFTEMMIKAKRRKLLTSKRKGCH